MLKIIRDKWDRKNSDLREALSKGTEFNSCGYTDLVKLTFEIVFNESDEKHRLDLDKITEIDNGEYQGTVLYLIPFATYQPCEFEYLMTYVGYGSCSGCDTLQAIQNYKNNLLSEKQISDFMTLCKDILTNTIKPYNGGWRKNEDYVHIEDEQNE